jgi:hypothetical protein
MFIIGVDYHPSFQQIAFARRKVGWCILMARTAKHAFRRLPKYPATSAPVSPCSIAAD